MHIAEPAEAEADAVPHDGRYRLVSIPPTATLFRHVVDRHVRLARRRGTTLRAVRRALRQRYPDAELSRQRNCRVNGEVLELWFAYRDGRAQPMAPQHGWWDHRGLAHVTLDASGRLTRPNAACRQLLELPPGHGPITLRSLLSSELSEELMLESNRWPPDEPWFGSLTLRLPTGRRLDIEFHIQPDGGQRSKVTMRSLADRDRANDWLALRQSAIGSMPASLLRDLYESGTRRTLRSGERFAKSLTDDAWVVLVTAGIMRLYVALDGYEPTLAYGNRGSLFGTHAFVPDEALLLGLQAVTPSVVLQLTTRRVEELAKSNPTFLRAITGDVQLQLREVIRSFAEHAAGDLRQRLAREILVLSDLHADDELVPVTEQQLADGIGSIRESVGRTIGDLRRDGSVATTRHGLLILDKERLRRVGQVGLD
ncbi:MAG TPA: Crp/Fnr family transcriptional regulator [Candidatus Limnocylindrales bacterium]|nr:Crp/Fnr family transcriptional regulator [Candidatus Limnocylindrales bacterium]